MEVQTDRLIYRDKQIDNKQIEVQTDREIDKQIYRETDRGFKDR